VRDKAGGEDTGGIGRGRKGEEETDDRGRRTKEKRNHEGQVRLGRRKIAENLTIFHYGGFLPTPPLRPSGPNLAWRECVNLLLCHISA